MSDKFKKKIVILCDNGQDKHPVNLLVHSVLIIKKPVNWFPLQINWLDSV